MQIELLNRQKWSTIVQLTEAIADFIENFYNPARRHSSLLEYLTPNELLLRSTLTRTPGHVVITVVHQTGSRPHGGRCGTRTHDLSRVTPSWVVSVTWGYRGNPSSERI